MAKAGREALAVLAGAAVWAVLWNVGTRIAQLAWPDVLIPGQAVSHAGILATYVAYSVVLSVLAGYVTARITGAHPARAVGILAGLQLALGIVFEVSYWSLLPVWYHLVFLALLVPATLYGGALAGRRRAISMRGA